MNIFGDIETLPDQREGARERHLLMAQENFKAPSSLTKTQALDDLRGKGVTYDKDGKFVAADQVKLDWEDAFKEDLAEVVGEESYRKTALTDDGTICVVCVKGIKGTSILKLGDSEETLLYNAFSEIRILCGQREPYFIGHNIPWDLERLYHKAVILGVDPGFKLPFDGRHGQHYYDTMQAWAGFKKQISQDNLCKALGIQGKPDDIDGSRVWDVWQTDPERVAAYCLDDVNKVEMIYNRLNFGG